MKRLTTLLLIVVVLALIAACAPATPEVVEKEVVVEKPVVETVVVEKEVVVEKPVVETVVVEKEVVVTATPPPAPTATPVSEVLIGVILPLTGPMGDPGRHDLEGMLLAADIVNEKHDVDLPLARTEGLPNLGGAKIKLIVSDNQGLPEKALADAERLITQNHIVAMASTYASSLAFPISEACERYGIPHLAGDPSAYGLTDRGFKWFFRSGPTDRLTLDAIVEFAAASRDDKGFPLNTWAIIHDDSIWAVESTEYLSKIAPESGFDVVEVIPIKSMATSLSGEVLRLKASNADILSPFIYAADSVLLTKTMEELDYKPSMIIANAGGPMTEEYLGLGKKVLGTLCRQEFDPTLGEVKPNVKYVNDLYKERTGVDMVTYVAKSFTGFMALADAINRAGSTDPEAIRQAILAIDIPPEQTIVTWGVKFDPETGQNILASTMLQQIQEVNGGYWYVTVWPWDVATRDIIYPIPPW